MSKKRKKSKKNKKQNDNVWTEEEYANYMGFEFIAGYTYGGMPYGIMKEDEDSSYVSEDNTATDSDDEEIPF